jgi:hypothetical protein
MLPTPYRELQDELAAYLPSERLIVDPLRLLAWGTDASFYRLVPSSSSSSTTRPSFAACSPAAPAWEPR